MSSKTQWLDVCANDDLVSDTGLCALLAGEQVAIFKLSQTGEVFALQNYDPFGHANVMSRGLIASSGEDLFVVSPLYKQHYCLRTGHCIEDIGIKLKTYPVRIFNDKIQLQLTG